VHWDPARLGIVMTISSMIGLAFNGPAGALVHRIILPRLWMALAVLCIVAGTVAMLPALVALGFPLRLAGQTARSNAALISFRV
jgi:hypothetical protein